MIASTTVWPRIRMAPIMLLWICLSYMSISGAVYHTGSVATQLKYSEQLQRPTGLLDFQQKMSLFSAQHDDVLNNGKDTENMNDVHSHVSEKSYTGGSDRSVTYIEFYSGKACTGEVAYASGYSADLCLPASDYVKPPFGDDDNFYYSLPFKSLIIHDVAGTTLWNSCLFVKKVIICFNF